MKRSPWLVGLALVAITTLTLGPALLHGSYTSRWGVPAPQSRAGELIDAFPKTLGQWELIVEGEPLREDVQRELGLAGYVNRYYRHAESGKVAMVLLMVGQPGPLVRHPPDICYGNRANKLLGEERLTVGGSDQRPTSKFRVLSYQPNSQLREPFRVAYAWSSGGRWDTPSMPRITYGGAPVLYKVQIQLPRSDADLNGQGPEEIEQLLEEFVAAFDGYLTEDAKSEG